MSIINISGRIWLVFSPIILLFVYVGLLLDLLITNSPTFVNTWWHIRYLVLIFYQKFNECQCIGPYQMTYVWYDTLYIYIWNLHTLIFLTLSSFWFLLWKTKQFGNKFAYLNPAEAGTDFCEVVQVFICGQSSLLSKSTICSIFTIGLLELRDWVTKHSLHVMQSQVQSTSSLA